jgi:hypothetical protein
MRGLGLAVSLAAVPLSGQRRAREPTPSQRSSTRRARGTVAPSPQALRLLERIAVDGFARIAPLIAENGYAHEAWALPNVCTRLRVPSGIGDCSETYVDSCDSGHYCEIGDYAETYDNGSGLSSGLDSGFGISLCNDDGIDSGLADGYGFSSEQLDDVDPLALRLAIALEASGCMTALRRVRECARGPEFAPTQLMRACLAGDAASACALLDLGARIDATDADGWSALMLAAGTGSDEVVRLLLARGATPARRSRGGNSAMLFAASGGHEGCVRQLFLAGAPIDEHNSSGMTAIGEALRAGHLGLAARFADEATPKMIATCPHEMRAAVQARAANVAAAALAGAEVGAQGGAQGSAQAVGES